MRIPKQQLHQAFRVKTDQRAPLKVVVVYDGFTDLIRAHEIWATLKQRFQGDIEFSSSAWNFALLRDPELRRKAAHTTSDASMVVFAASGRSELPDHMRNWIRTSMPGKGSGSALVAVLDNATPPTKTGTRICSYLRATAHKTGMDFFCNAQPYRPAKPARRTTAPN